MYDNWGSQQLGVYALPNSQSPSFGDTVHLAQGGMLTLMGLTLYNGDSSSGVITSGTTVVSFYDNTTPYTGGTITNPLLGAGQVAWDSTNLPVGGLSAGSYRGAFFDFSGLNIDLPTEVLIVQTFQGLGTSTSNGVVIGQDPTTGSSPNTIFVSTNEMVGGALTTLTGDASAGQVLYQIWVVPEPGTAMLVLGGLAAFAVRRRRA